VQCNVTSVLPQQQIPRHFSFPEIYCKARWSVPCFGLISAVFVSPQTLFPFFYAHVFFRPL